MKKFLILAFAILTACFVHAQIPKTITVPKGPYAKSNGQTEVPCTNQAGTISLGAAGVATQSNDLTLDTIWLCRNDSIFINHNGDFNLSGDPVPSTAPGVGYAFYTCPPTATGPTLQNITGQPFIAPNPGPPATPGQPFIPIDPCLLNNPPPPNGGLIYVASDNPNGDMWFFNSGFLQTTFNMGSPLLLHFAPITFDDATNNGYETTVQGGPPGQCVNVNTAAQFEVVYLNPVDATGLTTPFNGNACLGRFKLGGGYPEWDATASYTVNIYLESDPNIKALINTPATQLLNNFNVVFSVPQAGNYVIEIEDGKSCGYRNVVNMGACTSAENVGFIFPDATAGPGETVCVPITTTNFNNIQGFTTSVQWDPTVLQLLPVDYIQNVNGDLVDFDPVGNTETSLVADGFLGITHIGSNAATLNATEVLMEVCFQVLAQVDGVCSPLTFINQPSAINASNSNGNDLAVEITPGTLCVVYNPLEIDIDTLPSPCGSLLTSYTLTITGEEPPYEVIYRQIAPTAGPTFTLNNVPAGSPVTIPNLSAGTIVCFVTPQNGVDIANADTFQIVVVAPEVLGAALDLTKLPSCNGLADGEVSLTVFEGTNPVTDLTGYTFNWTGPTIPSPNGPVQSNIGAGNYSVTVTDAQGCQASASGTLGNPPQLNNQIPTITPATCTGLADGCFEYEMQGGTPFPGGLYMFDVLYCAESGCANPINQGDATANPYTTQCNLLAGFYTIMVTDANGCTFTDEIEVKALRTVSLVENLTVRERPSCFGGSDGVLGVDVIVTPAPPGGSNFFFSWPSAPTGSVITSLPTSSTITGVPAGAQFIAAIDGSGCSDTLTLFLDEPAAFTVVPITVTNPTCLSTTGGSLAVTGFGGTGTFADFTYTWAPNGTGSSISGLGEGTYTVTATDLNGCTAVFDTTLMLPPPPAISSINVTEVKCGDDGALTAVAPTGTGFVWTSLTNNVINNPNQPTITDLTGGTYVIQVTDANFCVNRDTIVLDSVPFLAISNSTLTNPSCNGYLDGSIILGVTGGTPTYSYAWSAPISTVTPTALALAAGSYTVTISDNNNCTISQSFTLIDPPAINVIVTTAVPNQVSCFGVCDGAATLLVNYQLNNDFNFNWADNSTDSVRIDLCAGSTNVTITETSAAQCFVVQEVIIGTPPPVNANPTETIVDSVSCNGLSDGRISVAGSGGNGGPYTYIWGGGQTTSTISNLPQGTYPVTITDVNGCTGTFSGVVAEPNPIIVAIDNVLTQQVICAGDDNGQLGVTATGGNVNPPSQPQYTYSWSDGANIIGDTNPLSMLEAGTYSVTVTDVKGCTGTTSLNLLDPPIVVGTYQLGDPLKCFGDETSITITNVGGGSGGPYTYTIDFGVPLPPSLASSISGGEHYITYIDQKNCEFTDTIIVPQPPQILVNFNPPAVEIQLGDSLELTPNLIGVSVDKLASFTWMPASFVKDPTQFNATLYTFESGTLMLTVVDSAGCTGKGSLEIDVDLNRNIYVPNAFIPNDPENGLNRLFAPGGGVGVEKVLSMQVFDRWGELMFIQENFTPESFGVFTTGWDGRFKGKFVDPGVYVYAIDVLFVDGKRLLYRGDVTVIR